MSDEARIRRDKIDLEHERNNQKDTENFMNTVRSQRHDYNFHLQTLSELIDRGDMDECKKYVEQLVEDSSIMNQILPVRDPAIAALINAFRIKAIQGGITLHIEIEDDLSHIATNEYETNKIIGNLLQNALDEIKIHQDKSYGIHLSILKRGEFNLIRVSNRVEGEHIARLLDDAIYKQGYTTKDSHDGVGLCSVRSLVRRYKGEIYTRIEDDIVYFVASVPIHYWEDL
jgi:sensor histidine kinase regulating citrate/malate metabolism